MKVALEGEIKNKIRYRSNSRSNGMMPGAKQLLAVERSTTALMAAVVATFIQLSRRLKERGDKLQDRRSRNTKSKKKMTSRSSNRTARRLTWMILMLDIESRLIGIIKDNRSSKIIRSRMKAMGKRTA